MESAKRWLAADSDKDSTTPESGRTPYTATMGTESHKKAKSRNTRNNNSINTQQHDQQNSRGPSNMIKVGSRILVTCGVDESWFKATVHKHREDNGAKRSFLVHFDGNRKTNQSWINEEQIAGILFHRESTTNSDTLPRAASEEPAAGEQDSPCQFDPLGADDIRERLRMQEARIDALVASHTDINTKVTTLNDCRDQMTSQNNITSGILTDYDNAISKLQDDASRSQEEIKRIQSNQDTRDATINVVQTEVADLSRKLEDECGDLRLHLDGLVGQVAAIRREMKDIQSNVEGQLGCLRDDSPHKALENKTLQDLVTEAVNQSIENNPTIAKIVHDNKRFTAKVTHMAACSKNHHDGLSNHAQALRELQSEHKGTKATTAKFNEAIHDLSKQYTFTATRLNRIELKETENEAKVDAGFQKVFSEIEYLRSLITGPSNYTRSAHITLKRKSPDSRSSADSEWERLPKLRSIDPKATPQSNSSPESAYHSTSYEQETSPSRQCDSSDKSSPYSRDESSEIDDKNEPNSSAPSFNFANPSFFFQGDSSATTPFQGDSSATTPSHANASNAFGSGKSAGGFTFGSTSSTFGSSLGSPSGGSASLSTNGNQSTAQKTVFGTGTSALVFGSSSAFSGDFGSLALSSSVQSFGSGQATEAKTEEPSSQATATTPFGSGATIPSFGSQKANPLGSFDTSSGQSSSGKEVSVRAEEASEITVTQRGYKIDDDMSIMEMYLLGKKKKEDSEPNKKVMSSLQHDEVKKKSDSKQAALSLQSNDVLLGRGGNAWKHHGNEQLRKIALERAAQYASSPKKGKPIIMR